MIIIFLFGNTKCRYWIRSECFHFAGSRSEISSLPLKHTNVCSTGLDGFEIQTHYSKCSRMTIKIGHQFSKACSKLFCWIITQYMKHLAMNHYGERTLWLWLWPWYSGKCARIHKIRSDWLTKHNHSCRNRLFVNSNENLRKWSSFGTSSASPSSRLSYNWQFGVNNNWQLKNVVVSEPKRYFALASWVMTNDRTSDVWKE